MNIWNNDEVIQFLEDHGYPTEYNDGLLKWLRDTYDKPYSVTEGGSTLPDLLKRYLNEFGEEFTLRILSKSGAKVSLVEPAATFTNTTPTSAAAGADTLLTSAGVHGLTGAVSVGASIYISGGTGWTVGFHTITAIAVDTTGVSIQIDTPFSAGFGTPTIALANTEVTLATIAVPALLANSVIEVDLTASFTGSTNAKRTRVKLNTTEFFNINVTAGTSILARSEIEISNRNSTSSQVTAWTGTSAATFGTNTSATTTGTVDTSVETSLTITAQPAVANEVMSLERYITYLAM